MAVDVWMEKALVSKRGVMRIWRDLDHPSQ